MHKRACIYLRQMGAHLEVCRDVGSSTLMHEAHLPVEFLGAPCCSSSAALSSSNSMPCTATGRCESTQEQS